MTIPARLGAASLRLSTTVDRYPAKMVSRFAKDLIVRYATSADRVLDPFCGSGAILEAAQERGIAAYGVDVNPYAVLLSNVKLMGFDPAAAIDLCTEVLVNAEQDNRRRVLEWPGKSYWFTPGVVDKYERLRHQAERLKLAETPEGRCLLLAMALSIRLCSKADQRSPKPFISRTARATRGGRHFDPFATVRRLVGELIFLYSGRTSRAPARVWRFNSAGDVRPPFAERFPCVITSPPYLNAQDYFRNFKLELYVLEGILHDEVDVLKRQFVGTERGDLYSGLSEFDFEYHRIIVPALIRVEAQNRRLGAVVHRYLFDMRKSIAFVAGRLKPGGSFVLVCGDNLVAGHRIRTWAALEAILSDCGFTLKDRYRDGIVNRMVPPKRKGHRGLIKQEVVSEYRLSKMR